MLTLLLVLCSGARVRSTLLSIMWARVVDGRFIPFTSEKDSVCARYCLRPREGRSAYTWVVCGRPMGYVYGANLLYARAKGELRGLRQ